MVSERRRFNDGSVPFVKAQRYVMQLKSQINSLEAELEEQRAQKQRALVENEQLRMELEALHRHNVDHESLQMSYVEAESKSCSLMVFLIILIILGHGVAAVVLSLLRRKITGH